MRCTEIRDVIMTDFVDGELDAEKAKVVNEHLAECHACRTFESNFVKTAVEPFKNARRENPPPYIWQNIRNGVVQKNALKEQNFFYILKGWLSLPKAVMVTATVVCLIFVSVFFITNQRTVVTNAPDKAQFSTEKTIQTKENYFSYLYEDVDTIYANEKGLGTAVEELILADNRS
ncbi:MAG: zf-HC2 domain-containing protein [Syntrophales bacterium]